MEDGDDCWKVSFEEKTARKREKGGRERLTVRRVLGFVRRIFSSLIPLYAILFTYICITFSPRSLLHTLSLFLLLPFAHLCFSLAVTFSFRSFLSLSLSLHSRLATIPLNTQIPLSFLSYTPVVFFRFAAARYSRIFISPFTTRPTLRLDLDVPALESLQ